MAPTTAITMDDMRAAKREWAGERIGFVPTMGALHEGHLSLIPLARDKADRVVVSIFVNPMQFGPTEDFARYPRTLREDLAMLDSLGVDLVFLPNAAAIYPDGFQTSVSNCKMANQLCGASRPGHFDGVLTVVLKLLNIVGPQVAVFGKKDYQQWRLIERMVKDLDLDLEVVGGETVREKDGLAKSSRNRYLDETHRALAASIYQSLQAAKELYDSGERSSEVLVGASRKVLDAVSAMELDYIELRDAASLMHPGETIEKPVVMLIAARLGETRLIDNMEIGKESQP